MLASLVGGLVNIPVARLHGRPTVGVGEIVGFGVRYCVPVVCRPRTTVLAVNLGGAVIPAGLSLFLVVKNGVWWQAALATAIVATLVHAIARPVPGLGIAVPPLVPPALAAAVALIVAPRTAAAVAYIAGSLGTLIGADLLNLHRLGELGAGVASIGGAGTFDGVFLSGAVVLVGSHDPVAPPALAPRSAPVGGALGSQGPEHPPGGVRGSTASQETGCSTRIGSTATVGTGLIATPIANVGTSLLASPRSTPRSGGGGCAAARGCVFRRSGDAGLCVVACSASCSCVAGLNGLGARRANVAGRGSQALTRSVKQRRWAAVVMRPDGSRGVSADLAAGATPPALLWASIGVLVLGMLTLGGAAALIYFGAREPRAPAPPAAERTGSGDRCAFALAPSTQTSEKRSAKDAETGPGRKVHPVPAPQALSQATRHSDGECARRPTRCCFRDACERLPVQRLTTGLDDLEQPRWERPTRLLCQALRASARIRSTRPSLVRSGRPTPSAATLACRASYLPRK